MAHRRVPVTNRSRGAFANHSRAARTPRRRVPLNPSRLVALLTRDGAALEFRIAKKLDSPNVWRAHWGIGHQLMKWWLSAFTTALAVNAGFDSMGRFIAEGQMPRVRCRMRVTVIRQVPNRRNFLRDDDDLRYTTKPLNDALKHAGLIYDDSREWMEQAMPIQEVSPDGLDWTIVRVEPDDVGAVTRQIDAIAGGAAL